MTKKKVVLVLVSLLAGATYRKGIRIKPGITRGLTDEQLDSLKDSKCESIKVLPEDEAKALIASKVEGPKSEGQENLSPDAQGPTPETDTPSSSG